MDKILTLTDRLVMDFYITFKYVNHAKDSFLANIKLWYIPEDQGC